MKNINGEEVNNETMNSVLSKITPPCDVSIVWFVVVYFSIVALMFLPTSLWDHELDFVHSINLTEVFTLLAHAVLPSNHIV